MRPTLTQAPRRAEQKIRSSGVVVSCLQKSEGFGNERATKDFNRGRCGISATPLLLHLWGAPKASSGREETRAAMSRRPTFHIGVFRRRPSTSCARVSCLVRIQSSSCANAPMSCGQQRSCWPQDDRRDVCERSPAPTPVSIAARPAAHRDGRRSSGATPVHTRLFSGPSQMQKPAKRPCPAADQHSDQCSQRPTPRPDWSNSKGRPGAPWSRVFNAQVSVGDTRERLCALGHTAATASPTAV